jgi:hypothetical protein
MKRRLAVVVTLVAVVAVPRLAHAAWWYTWSCSGQCAPGQLAITGVEGPFASQAECDSVRSRDGRADWFMASGNLGGLTFCEERDGAPTPGGSSGGAPGPLPTQRVGVGLVFGPGWGVRDVATDSGKNLTAGLHFNWRISGNPRFAISTLVGVELTLITPQDESFNGGDAMTPLIMPLAIGLAASPGTRKLRFDLAAVGGMHFGLTCGVPDHSCGGFYGELSAGVAFYKPTAANGFGFDVVFTGSQGSGLTAPLLLFRFAVVRRNRSLE